MTTQPTTRYYVAARSGPTALWVEQTGGGYGTNRKAIAFQEDLDRIHPVLWPTLLAQYDIAATPEGFADEDAATTTEEPTR